MHIFSKTELIERLKEIVSMGWIPSRRHGNDGGVGNTLEDLLGIEENNLPIPNAAEWELKTQRSNTTSLTTLFHMEPSPRALRFVPAILLPKYGWKHDEAGKRYGNNERSFRMTISGQSRGDRGFMVIVDRTEQKVLISFDASAVAERHKEWLRLVKKCASLEELCPQPYWGFADLQNKAGTKLLNAFYVQADSKKEDGREFFRYTNVMMLQGFSVDGLFRALEDGMAFVDFDARTGHNHGTKFRMRQQCLPMLYSTVKVIV